MAHVKRALIAAAIFGIALTIYLHNLEYRVWGAGGDTTPAEMLPLAIMRNHDLVFDGLERPPKSWWFHDIRGHVISGYPIIPGLFNVPTYFIARSRGVVFDAYHRAELSMITASIVTALSAAFFFLAVSRFVVRRSTALGATVVYAFGTTAFSVAARGIWQHGPSLLFLTIAIWLLGSLCARGSLAPPSTTMRVALSGLFLGFAVWNRPPNILIVLPLAIYVLLCERRAFAGFIGFAAIPAALMSWYSLHYWGSLTNLGQYSAGNWFLGHLGPGLLGIFFSPNRGLFVFTPLFVFSFVVIAVVLRHPRRDPLLVALAAGVLLTPLLYAKWWSWWGGTSFGYRLLTECVPALTILLAVGWERMFSRSVAMRVALAICFAFALYVNYLGAFYAPCGFDTSPDDVNTHPARLWSARDGEVARCTAKMLARVGMHLHRP
jgi:hypothetical protein